MAFKNQKKTNDDQKVEINYECKVTRVYQYDDNTVLFDMNVNGVDIKGFSYIFYTNKEGKEGSLISRPSRKGNDGKYYEQVFFPINSDLKKNIYDQIEALLS